MIPHIQNTFRKQMATGSALGRLLTIAFLCSAIIIFAFNNHAEAVQVEFRNNGNGSASFDVYTGGVFLKHVSIGSDPVYVDNLLGSDDWTIENLTADIGSTYVSDPTSPSSYFGAYGSDWRLNPALDLDVVYVNFELNQYPVNASVSGSGGIVTPPSAMVNYGNSHTVAIEPTTGYYISSVTDNSTPVTISAGDKDGFDYTISSVTEEHTIVVTFAIYQYPVNASVSGSGGTVTPPSAMVNYGNSHTVAIEPTTGYYISSVTDNSTPVTISAGDKDGFDYTISSVTEEHTIVVTFAIYQYPVNASVSGSGGIVTPPSAMVNYGNSHTVAIEPTTGYYISSVTDNSTPVTISAGDKDGFDYTISSVTEEHTIVVTFAIYQYPVNASVSGSGGIVTPPSAMVNYGNSHTVAIEPTTGYYISSVTDNSTPVTISAGDKDGFDYTISSVTEEHTVVVTFAIYQYDIATSVTGSGTATVAPGSPVDYGTDADVTITPAVGWHIASVKDNGSDVGVSDPYTAFVYTISSVDTNHTVNVTFAKTIYSLTYTVSGGGSVSPANGTTYVYDDGLAISATPALGWEFVNWTGDTGNLVDSTSASTALKNPLTANTDLTANFTLIDYTLTVTSAGGTGGTTDRVTVSASGPYHYGDVVTLTANPQAGETFAGWSANVVSTGATTGEVTMNSNQVVTATFDFIDYTLTVTSAGGTGGATDRVAVSPPGTYHYGDVVALTANPQVGETFANWGGDLAGSTNPETITINADKTVTANFEKIPVTLTMQVDILDGGAFGTVTPDPVGNPHSYLWGDTVSVSATPNSDTVLANWSSNVVGGEVTMNGDQTVIATFELKKYSVIFNAGAHGLVQEGTNPPTNSITQQIKSYSNSTEVKAVANPHYHFLNWTNSGGEIVSTVEGLKVTGVTQDMEFTANFEIDKFSVTFKSSNYGGIEVAGSPPEYYEDEYTEIVDWGSNSKLVTARLDDNSQFRGWHGDLTSDDLEIQVDQCPVRHDRHLRHGAGHQWVLHRRGSGLLGRFPGNRV